MGAEGHARAASADGPAMIQSTIPDSGLRVCHANTVSALPDGEAFRPAK